MIMKLVIREKGNRRLGMPADFPLIDSQGSYVIKDRRRLSDRRKAEYGLEDLMVMLSKMSR